LSAALLFHQLKSDLTCLSLNYSLKQLHEGEKKKILKKQMNFEVEIKEIAALLM